MLLTIGPFTLAPFSVPLAQRQFPLLGLGVPSAPCDCFQLAR